MDEDNEEGMYIQLGLLHYNLIFVNQNTSKRLLKFYYFKLLLIFLLLFSLNIEIRFKKIFFDVLLYLASI